MSLSQELIDRYTTEVDVDWRHAFVLWHPGPGPKYIIDHTEQFSGLWSNHYRIFEPVPTDIKLPSRDETGKHLMSITWCGITFQAQEYLDAALVEPTRPIECWYTVFILGDRSPQIDPYILFNLTDISINSNTVQATASRSDILNKVFPSEKYRPDKYPGLVRR